ncbi:MAG: hypothetical protein AB7O29_00680 [Acidimicrobiia bacterium]
MTAQGPGCLDADAATDLALGLVTGRERAEALAHLVGCARCRSLVSGLREAADALLPLAPAAEPPAGFEQRVLLGLASEARPSVRRWRTRRWSRTLAAAAAAAVLLAAGGDGAALARRSDPTPTATPAPVASAEVPSTPMRTDTGLEVGTVWRHGGEPSWVFVSVPGWRRWDEGAVGGRDYQLQLVLADGRLLTATDAVLNRANGTWATTISIDADDVVAVAVVDDDGRVWCTGRFEATA